MATYSWRIDNAVDLKVFKNYIPTKSTDQLEPHSKSDSEQPTYPFYTVKSGKVTVSCDLTLTAAPQGVKYAGGLPAFTANSWEVGSTRPTLPDALGTVTDGEYSLLPDRFWFGPSPSSTNGQDWFDVTYTIPDPFPQVGEGCFVQLITAERHLRRNTWFPHFPHYFYIKTAALDVAFPYPFPNPGWTLPGAGRFIDTPEQWLSITNPVPPGGVDWYEATAQDSFQTWAMFRPPSKDNQPTTWIPMASYEWSWYGGAFKVNGQWLPDPDSDGGRHDEPVEDFMHPEWSDWASRPLVFIGGS